MHHSPQATLEAARLLQLSPKALAAAAKAWAAQAAQDPRQARLFGKAPTADEAWAVFLKVGGVPAAPRPKPDAIADLDGSEEPSEKAAPDSLEAFAASVLEAASRVGEEGRFNGGRVYLRAAYDADDDGKPTWESWSAKVLEAERGGLLQLSAPELVGAMDAGLYEASAIPDPAHPDASPKRFVLG